MTPYSPMGAYRLDIVPEPRTPQRGPTWSVRTSWRRTTLRGESSRSAGQLGDGRDQPGRLGVGDLSAHQNVRRRDRLAVVGTIPFAPDGQHGALERDPPVQPL